MDQDANLITAAGQGDHRAFEILVKRHGTALFSFLFRYLGDRPGAEDLVQEVFIRLYTSAHKFKKVAGVKASSWIFKIAYHLAMNEIRRNIRTRKFHDEVHQSALPFETQKHSGQIKEWEIKKDMMAAVRSLPENQRAALLLRVNEGYSYKEISHILNCSVSGVEALIFRARTSLKAQFYTNKEIKS